MFKILKPVLFVLLPIVLLVVLSVPSYAILVKTLGSGNWTNAANWTPRAPQSGDEILIDVGHTITLTTSVTLNNVVIEVRGTLLFSGTLFPTSSGQLILNSNSLVVIATGGSISSNLPFGLSVFNQIEIGGTQEWNGLANGTVSGPSFIDTGGVQGGTPPGYIPLPVELITFNATLTGESIQISWATATELNNDYFTIERSTDGFNWSVIGETPGAGNSTMRIDYEYYDTRPIPGFLYYRLKQTDYDGQFEYFKAAVVRYEPENLFRVYPNPSTGPMTIITSGELTNAHILLHDISGKSISIPVEKAKHQAFLDISGVVDGVYILEIVYPQSRLTQRILKN